MEQFIFMDGFADAVLTYLTALVVFAIGLYTYTAITPSQERALVKAGNKAAALNLSVTIVTLALPIAAAVHNTHRIIEIAVWGGNAVLFQLLAYAFYLYMFPETNKAIAEDKSVQIWPLCATQIAVAFLNAAIFVS